MNTMDFYDDMVFQYPEIAECIEDTNTSKGKFFIPVLTPCIKDKEPYEKKYEGLDTYNLVNRKDIKVTPITYSNYIELPLPIGFTSAKKGDKFVVVFIGGDCNNPVLIGGVNNGNN